MQRPGGGIQDVLEHWKKSSIENCRQGEQRDKAGGVDPGSVVDSLRTEFGLYPEDPGKLLNGFKQMRVR